MATMIYRQSKIAAAYATLFFGFAGLPATASDSALPATRTDLYDLLWPGPAAGARVDHRDRTLTAAALEDRIVVVSFVSADCAIACVLRTMELDKVARAIPNTLRDRVVILGIDTVSGSSDAGRLRAFAEGLVGPKSLLRLLIGDPAGTAALADKLRYPASALPEPPPAVLLFDRRGKVAMTYSGDPLDGSRLLRDITVLETFDRGLD